MNKQIVRLAIPFIISNITVPLVSTVDTALMGHLGSTLHLGAIGIGGAIFNFIYWNFAFIRMSTVGLTAQEFGAKNFNETSRLLGRAVWVAFIAAIFLILFRNQLEALSFKIMKGEPEVEEIAARYFGIRIFAAPATLGLYALTGWFIGMQNAKAPMFISILVNLVNLGANFILVVHFGMKSEGVAWGTVIAQYTGLVFAVIVIFSKYRSYLKLITARMLIDFKDYGRFFKVNADIFVRTFAVIFVLTWYNFASAEKGTIILGVNVIFLQLVYAFSFFIDGFANASEALTGKYIGRKEVTNLKKVVKYTFGWGIALALIFTLVYLFAWRSLLKIYTSDMFVIEAAKDYIGWIIAIPLVSIVTFMWDGIFLGATATAEQRNATIVSAILFFGVYWWLSPKIDNHALLLAQLVFFGTRGILLTIYYKPAILRKLEKNQLNIGVLRKA